MTTKKYTFDKMLILKIIGILGVAVTALGYSVRAFSNSREEQETNAVTKKSTLDLQIKENFREHDLFKTDVKDGFNKLQEQMSRRFDSQQKMLDRLLDKVMSFSDQNDKGFARKKE